MSTETEKQFLLERDPAGYSVYQHLFNMVTTALEKNPQNIVKNVAKLPDFSRHIKGHRFTGNAGPAGEPQPVAVRLHPADVQRAKEERALFEQPEPEVITEIQRPTPMTTVTTTTVKPVTVPPFRPITEDYKFHRLAGVGVPRRECILIEQATARLVASKGLQDVVCFGKIFGTEGNYWVVRSRKWFADPEAKIYKEQYRLPTAPRKGLEVPMQPEPPGVGLNRYSFWVSSYAGGEWTELPDVVPQQVVAARMIKKHFTGNLKAEVRCHPPFPGLEENYLRVQLARITAATSVVPEGEVELFEAEEEDAEDEDADPSKPKEQKYVPLVTEQKAVAVDEGIEALASREKWVHTGMHIFKTGRATQLPPKPEVEGEEEPEPEEEEGEEKVEEEKKELLQAVAGDTRFASIKVPQEPKEGDEEGEAEEPKEDDDEEKEEEEGAEDDPSRLTLRPWIARCTNNFYKKHGVAVLKSLRWPGACSWVTTGQVSGSIYFGDGLKATDAAFSPMVPPPAQQEVEDITEMPDPTSMLEKLILRGEEPKEADSEDEKDDEEGEGEE